MDVVIVNGLQMFKKYVLDIKKKNKLSNVYIKRQKRKNKNGLIVAEYEYYCQKVKRSSEEIQELIAQGKDPESTSTHYKEKYIGLTPPANFEQDELSNLLSSGRIHISGQNLITDSSTFEYMQQVAPEYFGHVAQH
jgi:hypothetical protein